MTIRQSIDWAERQLGEAGVPNPRVDAEWLLADVLGVRRNVLWTHGDHIVADAQHAQFAQYVARRRTREPLQYILGTQEFYGRVFRVTPDVLIPRPETELLVESAVKFLKDPGPGTRDPGLTSLGHESRVPCPVSNSPQPFILEIGTGSGCIAITLALECPMVQIVATDISPAALAIARTNAATHDVTDRIEFLVADVTSDQRPAISDCRYDLIISNPPYCPEPQWATLQPEVRDFEPRHALIAGKDGLDFLRRIIQDVPARLTSGGRLLLEIGDGQAEAVKEIARRTGAYAAISVQRDYHGIERIVTCQRQAASD